jgi:hypothetical protein
MPRTTALTLSRWTRDDARAVLSAQEASGLCVAAYAAEAGLDPQRLYAWRRKLAGNDGVPTFVELAPPSRERMEIVLRDGRVVRIPDAFNAEALRHLLEVLEPTASC